MSVPVEEEGAVAREPVLLPPRGLAPALIAMMGLVAALGILHARPLSPVMRPSLRLTGWVGEPADGDEIRQRRERLLAEYPPSGTTEALRKILVRYLRKEQKLGFSAVGGDPGARRLLGTLEEGLRRLSLREGNEALRAFAIRYAADVAAAVSGGGAAQMPGSATSTGLDAIAPGSEAVLRRAGLLSAVADPQMRPSALLVIEAVAELRVLAFGRRVPPPRPTLDSDLRRMLLRYRVEVHGPLDLRRKLQLLDELRTVDPSYPAAYAEAVLLARAGRYRAARGAFLAAAARGQNGRLARANARWCRERMGDPVPTAKAPSL